MNILAIGGILLTIFIHAVLVASEFSLVKLRYKALEPKELERQKRKKIIAWVMARAEKLACMLRFASVVGTFIVGFLLFYVVDRNAPRTFPFQPQLIALGAVMAAISIHYLIADWMPRSLAVHYPNRVLRFVGWILPIVYYLFGIWVDIIGFIAEKIFRIRLKEDFGLLDVPVQLRAMGQEDTAMTGFTQKIVSNTLRMRDLEVSDIFLPRSQIQYMNIEDDVEKILSRSRQVSHTRFPLCEGDLDQCIGIIHIKDIYRYQGDLGKIDLRKIMRPIHRFKLNEPVEHVLKQLLRRKIHMALVVDDFDGTAGLITLEHVLEELVGEIQDEFDREPTLITAIAEDTYRVSGLVPLHDLEEKLDISFNNEKVSTVGGFITSEIGRIPEKGETFTLPPVEIQAQEVDKKRVISVIIKKLPELEKEED